MSNKFKNPITIVQGAPTPSAEPLISWGGSSAPAPIQTASGDWFLPYYNNAHGLLMTDKDTRLVADFSTQDEWRVIVRANFTEPILSNGNNLTGSSSPSYSTYVPSIYTSASENSFRLALLDKNGSEIYFGTTNLSQKININEWYYFCVWQKDKIVVVSIYDDDGTLVDLAGTSNVRLSQNNSYYFLVGGANGISSSYGDKEYIDINGIYVEKQDQPLWGSTNSKTQNMGVFRFDDWNEFTEVEYIESTGTQYLDLGIVPNDTCGVKMDVMYTATGDRILLGCRNDNSSDSRFYIGTNNGRFYLGWNTNEAVDDRLVANINTRYTVYLNYSNDRQRRRDSTYGVPITSTLHSQSKNIYVFCGNTAGTPQYYSSAKLYGLDISFGIDVTMNLVPCYHTVTGVIGMFDTVNNKFYMNAGTGEFIKGPDIVT